MSYKITQYVEIKASVINSRYWMAWYSQGASQSASFCSKLELCPPSSVEKERGKVDKAEVESREGFVFLASAN